MSEVNRIVLTHSGSCVLDKAKAYYRHCEAGDAAAAYEVAGHLIELCEAIMLQIGQEKGWFK